ncbi:hypothetical protein [Actinoplanes sp. N902-109]|uniref:hypothetical protein n=1 Tax=Actinoplanes sp. (strain N902-109) TaxID=649831 RepID=UPI0012F77ED0|nr:hypothetical protein [Actinoplanes sp. N902-109]
MTKDTQGPGEPAKKAAPVKRARPAKQTPAPAKKAASAEEHTATRPAPPAKQAPAGQTAAAKQAAPAKKTAAAKQAPPAKRAAKAVKAAAAEIAPALVEPNKETVPDEPAATLIEEQATAAAAAGKAVEAAKAAAVPTPAVRTAEQPANSPAAVEARTEAWARILADPGHTPELLALTAVRMVGPRAADWVREVREAYPAAGADAVARLAARQFSRFGAVSSVFAAVAGSYASITLLGAAALTQAQVALHIAAAYGLDPADEARAVDLLVLGQVHPTREDAAAALAAATDHSYEGTGLTDAVWRLGKVVTSQAGAWAGIRLVNRFFPGTSLLAATLSGHAAAQAAAARATVYYSQVSQLSGSSV